MILLDTTPDFYCFTEKPVEYQRFVFFSGKIQTSYRKIEYIEKDNIFHYTDAMYEAKFGKSLYLKSSKLKGFTYNPETKKVSVWFKMSISTFDLKLLFEYLNMEWVLNENIYKYITKTLFEKILSKRITNPYDACLQIIKSNHLKCSPELLRKQIKSGLDKAFFLKNAYVAKDINHYLEKNDNYIDMDLYNQANILGKKIDFKWSRNRMREVHSEWTKEIMELELSFIDDDKLEYELPTLPPEFECISSQKRLFEEGSIMHHCVYTNYLQQVLSNRYMVFHCEYKGNKATVGIELDYKNKPYIQQIQSIGNSPPSTECKNFIHKHMNDEFLNKLAVNFIKRNKIQYASEYVPVVEMDNLPF